MKPSLCGLSAIVLAAALGLVGCTSTAAPSSRVATALDSAAVGRECMPPVSATHAERESSYLTVCSFNIQFLGQSTRRDNVALADLLAPYDIVVIQELTAAPATRESDSGPRSRAAEFFSEMGRRGFSFHLSESDTGPNGPQGTSTTKTEWWVTFFRADRVVPANDVPHGFISAPLTKNSDFDRVPYALGLRSADGHFDFVLLSVHLNPDKTPTRRAHEIAALGDWVSRQVAEQHEKDFIILGDTNIQSRAELRSEIPLGLLSLNDSCVATNVAPKTPRPYDQVIFNPTYTTEIDRDYGFHVVNLIEAMRLKWKGREPYPGAPYQSNVFRFYYSDHNPVVFRIAVPEKDDD